eukprot:scaffold7341_cov229-Pinguiococcus_pyrenoidosus.AAC.16
MAHSEHSIAHLHRRFGGSRGRPNALVVRLEKVLFSEHAVAATRAVLLYAVRIHNVQGAAHIRRAVLRLVHDSGALRCSTKFAKKAALLGSNRALRARAQTRHKYGEP